MENDTVFNNMIKGLEDSEKQWLRTRFVDNTSLSDTEKMYNITNGATYEQQIMRKMRRVAITEQL
jgi:hypothetical protein